MRKFFAFSILCLSLLSCDDGDIITTELEFDDTFIACGDLVIYKTKTDPNQSLSLQINNSDFTIADMLVTQENTDNSFIYELENNEFNQSNFSSNYAFKYRSYASSVENLFCNDVPPDNIQITEDYTSGGNFTFFVTLTEDDNDGIPAELEDDNADGDNNYLTNPLDTDQDGIPNYMDVDDDGDNVLTTSESANYETGMTYDQLQAAALDTDGDGTPNYLDNDDDGDNVLTINEENSTTQDNNPTNDVTNSNIGPDYLNPEVNDELIATTYREHTIYDTFKVKLIVSNLDFSTFEYQTYDFGYLVDDNSDFFDLSKSRTEQPTF